jgi:hypothetical protein
VKTKFVEEIKKVDNKFIESYRRKRNCVEGNEINVAGCSSEILMKTLPKSSVILKGTAQSIGEVN